MIKLRLSILIVSLGLSYIAYHGKSLENLPLFKERTSISSTQPSYGSNLYSQLSLLSSKLSEFLSSPMMAKIETTSCEELASSLKMIRECQKSLNKVMEECKKSRVSSEDTRNKCEETRRSSEDLKIRFNTLEENQEKLSTYIKNKDGVESSFQIVVTVFYFLFIGFQLVLYKKDKKSDSDYIDLFKEFVLIAVVPILKILA